MKTWLKWETRAYGMVEKFDRTVEQARKEYADLIKIPEVLFAQWGVKSDEGSIVLGEYRRFPDGGSERSLQPFLQQK